MNTDQENLPMSYDHKQRSVWTTDTNYPQRGSLKGTKSGGKNNLTMLQLYVPIPPGDRIRATFIQGNQQNFLLPKLTISGQNTS